MDGQLHVIKILAGGAVDRYNSKNSQKLLVGDVLLKVNDVQGSDDALVAECKSKSVLDFQVIRYMQA